MFGWICQLSDSDEQFMAAVGCFASLKNIGEKKMLKVSVCF